MARLSRLLVLLAGVLAAELGGPIPVLSATAQAEGQPLEVTDGETLASSSSEGCYTPYCCPDSWLYARFDYLHWWTKAVRLPPLVTTSYPGTDLRDAGILGGPGTSVLVGNSHTSSGPFSGLRFTAGVGLGEDRQWWLLTDFLLLESISDGYTLASDGATILARPFYDLAIHGQNSELVSFPSLLAGEIRVATSSDLWGAGAALQANAICCEWPESGGGYRVDLLLGYRFLQHSDDVRIDERLTTTAAQGPLLVGTCLDVRDTFLGRSYFHGLELGMRGEWARNRFFLAGEARVALGNSHNRVVVDGATTVSVPGQVPITYSGGLLAMGTALGERTDDEFAVVPQAELRVGRHLTDHLRCSIGYSLLYWSQVARAADNMNTTINTNQLSSPGVPVSAADPTPILGSRYWGQGLTASLEWEY